ncbi:MAG: hypothetical protein DRP67_04770 [Candidatus Omnitrophota bacterium]|nr:MAG: hypothetical protein DRP67_04770 [Candidatus Omnitrophota bacterium]
MDFYAIASIVIFAGVYIFIALEKIPKMYIAISGVILLVFFRVYTPEDVLQYIDWDTIGFLFGTFITVKILEISGFFNYLSLKIAKKVNYDPLKILIVFPVLSWFLSSFVSSITLLVFMAPLTYGLSKVLKFDPVPFLIAEACLANIGGAGTLMGDPPNVILGSKFGLGFTDFFIHNYILSLISGAGAILIFYHMNKGNILKAKSRINKEELACLVPEDAIEDRYLIKLGIISLSFTVVLLILRDFIKKYLPLSIGLCGVIPPFAVLSFRGSYPKLKNILKEIDIETIIFFISLFAVVGALEKTLVIKKMAYKIGKFSSNGIEISSLLLWLGAFSSAFIDNVPEAMSIGYLIKHLLPHLSYSFTILVWASSLGLDIGGNFTPIGASANVVAYCFLENQDIKIGWGRWFKLSFLPTIVALLICWIGILLKFITGFY